MAKRIPHKIHQGNSPNRNVPPHAPPPPAVKIPHPFRMKKRPSRGPNHIIPNDNDEIDTFTGELNRETGGETLTHQRLNSEEIPEKKSERKMCLDVTPTHVSAYYNNPQYSDI